MKITIDTLRNTIFFVRLSFIHCKGFLLHFWHFLIPFTSADHWDPGMQEAEKDGYHGRLRPLCKDQAAWLKGKADWEEEEDNDQECKPQSVLQRILCVCRWGDVIAKGKISHLYILQIVEEYRPQVNLEVTVLDYDRIGGSDPIGKVLQHFKWMAITADVTNNVGMMIMI